MVDWIFWNDQSRWPSDSKHYTFLGRFVLRFVQERLDRGNNANERRVPPSQEDIEASLSEIVELFRFGKLKTGLRPSKGGSFKPLRQTDWNGEVPILLPRFYQCKMHRKHIFDGKSSGETLDWIFVKSSSARTFFRDVQIDMPDRRYLSDYLQFMIFAAQELKLTKGGTSKHEVKARLKELWTGEKGDLSEKLADHMATFVRWTEDKKGKAGKKYKH